MTRIYRQPIEDCVDCPNSYHINRIDGGGLACEAHDDWMIADGHGIPEWCPLEERYP